MTALSEADYGPVRFLVKRACRVGKASRSDLGRIWQGCAPATCSKWMDRAVTISRGALERKSKRGRNSCVELVDPAKTPSWARVDNLLEELAKGPDPVGTGLFGDEVRVFIPRWTDNKPSGDRTFERIVKALLAQSAVDIVYVGMRKGETARPRRIFPIGLEKAGDQWRLLGSDLERRGYPLRTFVLSRISACSGERLPPADMGHIDVLDGTETICVNVNPDLTEDQANAIRHELNIKDGTVVLHTRTIYDFLARFGRSSAPEHVVWPPIEVEST